MEVTVSVKDRICDGGEIAAIGTDFCRVAFVENLIYKYINIAIHLSF